MILPEPYLPNDVPGLVRQLTRLWGNLKTLLQTVDSGTYTPTLTNVANMASAVAQPMQWMRVGNTVTVSGRVDIAVTAASTQTQVGISLPVTSNITAAGQVAGAGVVAYATPVPMYITTDTANKRGTLVFMPSATASTASSITFTYLLQ